MNAWAAFALGAVLMTIICIAIYESSAHQYRKDIAWWKERAHRYAQEQSDG